jgi:hypothetical protein
MEEHHWHLQRVFGFWGFWVSDLYKYRRFWDTGWVVFTADIPQKASSGACFRLYALAPALHDAWRTSLATANLIFETTRILFWGSVLGIYFAFSSRQSTLRSVGVFISPVPLAWNTTNLPTVPIVSPGPALVKQANRDGTRKEQGQACFWI